MLLFLNIAGGVALILFGVRFLRKGLDRLFGPQLGRWLQRMARSRLRAFASGVGVSIVAPSSTTISILAVQAVQLGHLSALQMLAVMLGANIGMTLMVVLIALQLQQYAPILILLGVALYQFTRSQEMRGFGQAVLSLGLIFTAIGIISAAGAAFEPGGDFVELLQIVQAWPIPLAIVAALLAVGLQSSTAAIGLVLGLAAAEVVDLGLAVPVVLGANVGLTISTLIVGWIQTESRRLALGNMLAKASVALVLLLMLPVTLELVAMIPLDLPLQIAITHTLFNVLVAVVFLPLVGPMHTLTRRIITEPEHGAEQKFGPKYITKRPMEGFSLATGQSMREILRVSEIVRGMLTDCWHALNDRNMELAHDVQDRDDQVDLLDTEIKRFLSQLVAQEGHQDDSGEVMRQLRYLAELETIGDVIDKNLAELVVKRIRKRIEFSPEGWEELDAFYRKVAENMMIAETAFTTRDTGLAKQLLDNKQAISNYEHELRDRHFKRLQSGVSQTHESSSVHLDLLTHLKRVNNHVSHVAYAVLQYEPRRGELAVGE